MIAHEHLEGGLKRNVFGCKLYCDLYLERRVQFLPITPPVFLTASPMLCAEKVLGSMLMFTPSVPLGCLGQSLCEMMERSYGSTPNDDSFVRICKKKIIDTMKRNTYYTR